MLLVRRFDLLITLSLGSFVGAATAVFADRLVEMPWLGIVVSGLVFGLGLRRPIRRWRATRRMLPAESKRWLKKHVAFYASLNHPSRARFERDVQIALAELRFEGVAGVEPTDNLKLAVAAGAALLLHGRPDWDLPRGHTVLFYPGPFDDGYDVDDAGRFDGMINQQGPILFSAPAVEKGWRHDDGLNVVLHELAHLLDFQGSGADGLPALLAASSGAAWQKLVREEIEKVRRGRSVLRAYAATNSAELFAVAVEQFFERPERLHDRHPDLFDALVALFNLDPTPGAVGMGGGTMPTPPAHVE